MSELSSIPLRQSAGPHRFAPVSQAGGNRDGQLMAAARELEASFLAEMLKAAGLGTQPTAFGGGAGEDQFASFLRLEQAREMVAGGGIGLAQSLFESMKERENGPVQATARD